MSGNKPITEQAQDAAGAAAGMVRFNECSGETHLFCALYQPAGSWFEKRSTERCSSSGPTMSCLIRLMVFQIQIANSHELTPRADKLLHWDCASSCQQYVQAPDEAWMPVYV